MERIEISRDCDAIEIPAGRTVQLKQGTTAFITQALGGAYTVQVPAYGGLFRISGADADAIGKEVREAPAAPSDEPAGLEAQVWEQLKSCYDPEIPVNIVDLGLVYDTRIARLEDGTSRVEIKMTLTAPGCGMGTAIAADAEDKLRGVPGVSEARVDIVWDPPWNPRMISDEGRRKLGI